MISRRQFIQRSATSGLAVGLLPFVRIFPGAPVEHSGASVENSVDPAEQSVDPTSGFSYQSDFIKLQANPEKPSLNYFSTDSLGQAGFAVNPLLPSQDFLHAGETGSMQYKSKTEKHSIAWYRDRDGGNHAAWALKCQEKRLVLQTRWQEGNPIENFPLSIGQKLNHATVLGNLGELNQVRFPCILHLPGMGTFCILCSDPAICLYYDAARYFPKGVNGDPFINIAFPGASSSHPDITYTLESVTIFPDLGKFRGDTRLDGVRRNYINIFQLNPRLQVLANNSASDACTFTVFLYAEMARHMPEMAKGLTAMDLIRNSLDHYLAGMKGYGQVGYNPPSGWLSEHDSSDSMPSLIMSACYYILDTADEAWAKTNYAGIKAWADKMAATDTNKDGIIEYGYSGNSNSWDEKHFRRPANWWDTIGFGHDDAYSNILAYRAYSLMARVAEKIDKQADSQYFASQAAKLKGNFYGAFHNPATGLIAGWRSEDGKLHDYYFLFVNSMAVCYGLLDDEQGRSVMNILLAKMKEVGYTDFHLGLPGNLIPVRNEDYVAHSHRWGWGQKDDGSDGFQIYENGGATGCYAYFTIKALYQLNMKEHADGIFFPMLESFKNGGFEGRCTGSDMSKDWKTWNGECWGYEGFLVDNYLPLLAVQEL